MNSPTDKLHARAVAVARRLLPELADTPGVAVVGARSHERAKSVSTKNGRAHYAYQTLTYNLHDHGVRRRQPRRWILVGWHKRKVMVWAIPGRLCRGMTVQITAEPIRALRSPLHRYRVAV